MCLYQKIAFSLIRPHSVHQQTMTSLDSLSQFLTDSHKVLVELVAQLHIHNTDIYSSVKSDLKVHASILVLLMV